jgi:hypothetical protein
MSDFWTKKFEKDLNIDKINMNQKDDMFACYETNSNFDKNNRPKVVV